MKKVEVLNMSNVELLTAYTAQCYNESYSKKRHTEQKWILGEILKRLGETSEPDLDEIMQM